MKKTLLPFLLLGSFASFAQTAHTNPFLKKSNNRHQQLVDYLLGKQSGQSGSTAQKPTGTKQRVIAQTGLDETMQIMDSTAYKYSGTNGSMYNYNSSEAVYNEDFPSDYFPSSLTSIENTASQLLADSIFSYQPQDGTFNVIRGSYNSSKKIDSTYEYNESNPVPYETKKFNQFNSSGYLTKVIGLQNQNVGGAFDTVWVSNYYYNTAGTQLLSDTTYTSDGTALNRFMCTSYHYNAQNKSDTIKSWMLNGMTPGTGLTDITAMDYYSAGQLRKVSSFSYNGTATPYASNVDSFGYTGSLPFYTLDVNTYADLEMGTTEINQIEKFVGSNNLPDSMVVSYGDGSMLMAYAYAKYHHNSFNNPDTLTIRELDSNTPMGKYTFYYETYDDGISGIKGVNNRKSLNVYPNPFDNNVNIDWTGNTTAVSSITLTNMLGQNIYSASLRLASGHNTIDLPALSKGQYILTIRDASGDTYSRPLTRK